MRNELKKIKFKDSINQALHFSMKKDKNLLCYGLGVTDPKGVFGTTLNLEKKFGKRSDTVQDKVKFLEACKNYASNQIENQKNQKLF